MTIAATSASDSVLSSAMNPGGGAGGGIALLLVILFLYFVPAVVAHSRKHRNASAIQVLNIFAGWTIVGWLVALVWACTNPAPAIVIANQPVSTSSAFCGRCGAARTSGGAFCSGCGAPFVDIAPAAARDEETGAGKVGRALGEFVAGKKDWPSDRRHG